MTAPGPLGAAASAEAELAILRAAAIRHLMERGAMRAEAVAAVDEQLGVELARDLVRLYAMLDGLDAAAAWLARHVWPRLAAAFTDAARHLAPVLAHIAEHAPAQPGHPVPDDDRWAAVLELKRAGGGSGPPAPRMDGRRAA